jgi:hypothetical protein
MRRFRFVLWIMSALPATAIPAAAMAQIISITIAPPELPVYEQPPLPAPGYIWTPGYWAYGPDGYFWVPGTWVEPPAVGLLWTPGYWAWRDGVYAWNAGYWGPHIGFYGGVNYGFGYGGLGYEGGYWNNGVFAYNRTVNNFGGVAITNVYNKTVINNTTITRVSFNGGTGGTTAQLTPQEQAAHDHHVTATASQTQHEHTASTNRALLASENHGRPAIAATSKPGEFAGKGVVAAREAKPRPVTPGAAAAGVKPLETKPLDNRALGNKGAAGNARAATNNGANGAPPKPPQAGVKSPPAGAKPVAAAPKPYPPAKPAPRVAAVAQHPALHQAPPPAAKPKTPPPHKPEH